MRVLAIVYCYPPMLVPAAICYAKLIHGLVRSGVEVDVVRIDPATFDSPGTPEDDSLTPLLPASVGHHVVRSPEKSFWVKVANRLDGRHRFTRRWLEPRKREWTHAARTQLRDLDLGRYDLLLSCSQPHANHLLALELLRRRPMPWIAYFSDPWTDNPYAVYPSPGVERYHRALEAQVLAAADQVLFTCEEMRRFVLNGRPQLREERTGVLPHAFVREWYRAARGNAERRSGVRLLHTGSFYGPRTPLPLLEALERLGGAERLEGRLHIDHYGGMDDAHRRQIEQRGLGGVIATHGFVPYLQSLSLMADVDGLLLVDAPLTSTSESVFLPSKLIDYLGARRPVVALTPGHGATARVVRETGGILCPLEEPTRLDAALRDIVEGGSAGPLPDETAVRAYDDAEVGQSLATRMEALVGAWNGPSSGGRP